MQPHSMSMITQTITKNYNKRSWISDVKVFFSNTIMLNTVTFAVVVILAVAYIFHVNSVITQGYEIQELEQQISELQLQNQELELTSQQAKSLENINRSIKMLGFEEVGELEYVNIGTSSYALAE